MIASRVNPPRVLHRPVSPVIVILPLLPGGGVTPSNERTGNADDRRTGDR